MLQRSSQSSVCGGCLPRYTVELILEDETESVLPLARRCAGNDAESEARPSTPLPTRPPVAPTHTSHTGVGFISQLLQAGLGKEYLAAVAGCPECVC